jgi:hypothetical protein
MGGGGAVGADTALSATEYQYLRSEMAHVLTLQVLQSPKKESQSVGKACAFHVSR